MTKLIPGKLYKPLELSEFYFFHKKGGGKPSVPRVRDHLFLFYVENQYNVVNDEIKGAIEHFFLDANGEKVALWGSPKEEDFSHLLERVK